MVSGVNVRNFRRIANPPRIVVQLNIFDFGNVRALTII
jgi:hypothetical protein